jgi:hypothetical protein
MPAHVISLTESTFRAQGKESFVFGGRGGHVTCAKASRRFPARRTRLIVGWTQMTRWGAKFSSSCFHRGPESSPGSRSTDTRPIRLAASRAASARDLGLQRSVLAEGNARMHGSANLLRCAGRRGCSLLLARLPVGMGITVTVLEIVAARGARCQSASEGISLVTVTVPRGNTVKYLFFGLVVLCIVVVYLYLFVGLLIIPLQHHPRQYLKQKGVLPFKTPS